MIAMRPPATVPHALCVGGEHEASGHAEQNHELVYASDSFSPPPAHSTRILPLPPRPHLVPIDSLRDTPPRHQHAPIDSHRGTSPRHILVPLDSPRDAPHRPQLIPIDPPRDNTEEHGAPSAVIQNTGKVTPARPVPILLRTVKMKNSEQFYDFKSVWLDTHRILNNAREYFVYCCSGFQVDFFYIFF